MTFFQSGDSEGASVSRRPLRADLKNAVERDNLKFLREKERGKSGGSVTGSGSGWVCQKVIGFVI